MLLRLAALALALLITTAHAQTIEGYSRYVGVYDMGALFWSPSEPEPICWSPEGHGQIYGACVEEQRVRPRTPMADLLRHKLITWAKPAAPHGANGGA